MADIERARPYFRGGNANRPFFSFTKEKNMLKVILNDLFKLAFYQKFQISFPYLDIDRTYFSNEDFWKNALEQHHFQTMRIQLQGFHLTEWLPSAPGRYFTSGASSWRQNARFTYDKTLNEFSPKGKANMVFGGIGSIRLSVKRIESTNIYFLGASSTGISHQGIPIAVSELEYHKVIRIINKHGGCFVNLTGVLQSLTNSTISLQYDDTIPNYCLIVDNINILRPSLSSELLVTVAITYPQSSYSSLLKKDWSFCSFCPGSDDKTLRSAVNWLKDYAQRHSGIDNPPILSEFDELYKHFNNAIEFPLSHVFDGSFNMGRLEEYQDYYELSINLIESNKTNTSTIASSKEFHHLSKPQSYRPVNIFISYAKEDEALLSDLIKHLKLLQRQGHINIWHTQSTEPGREWQKESKIILNKAHIILLLVSADFINSEICYSIEMQQAMELHRNNKAVVIPIILRPVHWRDTPFGHLQALPMNLKPITDLSWYNLDSACFNVTESIRKIIEQITINDDIFDKNQAMKFKITDDKKLYFTNYDDLILIRTFTRANHYIMKTAIDFDKGIIIGAGNDINAWNLHTGELLYTLSGIHTSSIAIISDENMLVSGHFDKEEIRIWNLLTGELAHVLPSSAHHIAIDHRGKILCSTNQNIIKVWDLKTKHLLHTLKGHATQISSLTIATDKYILVSGDSGGTIKVWDLYTGEQLRTFIGHLDEISSLAIIPNSHTIISLNAEKSIKMWNLYTGSSSGIITEECDCAVDIAVSFDGQILAVLDTGKKMVELWNISIKQIIHTFKPEIRSLRSITFDPQGQLIISGGNHYDLWYDKGNIEIWGRKSDGLSTK